MLATSAAERWWVERLAGWSRQLRITPLQPAAYIAIKMATSLVLGLAAVVAVYAAGILTHNPSTSADLWVATGSALWIGSLLFAAFRLFVGYLLPSENAMQIIGFALMLFSFGRRLFIPLSQFSHPLRVLATYTPLYGLNELVRYPLVQGSFNWTSAANLIARLVIFAAGVIWRFRKDTARARAPPVRFGGRRSANRRFRLGWLPSWVAAVLGGCRLGWLPSWVAAVLALSSGPEQYRAGRATRLRR